jgi:lipoate-protein ligase A
MTASAELATEWRVLVDGARPGVEHMATDARLGQQDTPTVRLFWWGRPALSLGYRQPVPPWVAAAGRAGLEVVERPTGGGVAFHGSDVSVAVAVPRRLRLPLRVALEAACETAVTLCAAAGRPAAATFDGARTRAITCCLAEASPYDVLIAGCKVAGFGVRRFPRAWLLQGSLLVGPLPAALQAALPADIAATLRERARPLHPAAAAADVSELAWRWASGWPAWWEEAVVKRLATASLEGSAHRGADRLT